ncbi:hypothetical protein GCM10027601_33590 [Nocardioides ungokensis]
MREASLAARDGGEPVDQLAHSPGQGFDRKIHFSSLANGSDTGRRASHSLYFFVRLGGERGFIVLAEFRGWCATATGTR